jgi:ankyrin repeat protein
VKHPLIQKARLLFDYEADINPSGNDNWTAMHFVSQGFFNKSYGISGFCPDVAQLLLEHGANVGAE